MTFRLVNSGGESFDTVSGTFGMRLDDERIIEASLKKLPEIEIKKQPKRPEANIILEKIAKRRRLIKSKHS